MLKIALTLSFIAMLSACANKPVVAPEPPPSALAPGFNAELEGYEYPFPVQKFAIETQKQSLHMSFMDLKSAKDDGPVIVLLHGKNFGGYAFAQVAKKLQSMGYRVIIPDQIGFGKSSKPANFQYTFQALATMTNQLLDAQGVKTYSLLGHSMGGMLATRMALMFPEKVAKLILVNPIGLEDWKLMTSYKSVDETYRDELKSTPESIKKYQSEAYYGGEWKPEYDPLIEAASGWTKNPDFPMIAWNSALTADMAFTQPVFYEFKNLKTKTALIIGQKDKTALGKAWASEENKKKMGLYPQLGRQAHRLIPRSKLYELKGVGHVPFVENLDQFFNEGLIPALKY